MQILIFLFILSNLITPLVSENPFELRIRTSTSTPISKLTLQEIQRGNYSDIFFISNTWTPDKVTICIGIGHVITVATRIALETANRGVYNIYALSENYIRFFMLEYQRLLNPKEMNDRTLFYVEANKEPTRKNVQEITENCGLGFSDSIRDRTSYLPITISDRSNTINNRFMFINKAYKYSIRPQILEDKIRAFITLKEQSSAMRKDNHHYIENGDERSEHVSQFNISTFPSTSTKSTHRYLANNSDEISTELKLGLPNNSDEISTDLKLGLPGYD